MCLKLNNIYLRDQPWYFPSPQHTCQPLLTLYWLYFQRLLCTPWMCIITRPISTSQVSKRDNGHQQMFLKVTNNHHLELTGKEIFNSQETLSQVPRSTQYCSIMENCFIHFHAISHSQTIKLPGMKSIITDIL